MKFMELDEGGFIHHIMDDPCITMLPVVNRFSYTKPKLNDKGQIVSLHGHRLLGPNPTEHPAHLLPRELSDEHFQMIMSSGGVGGLSHGWQWKWDDTKQAPVQFYFSTGSTLPDRKFSGDVPDATTKKPCAKCPNKDKASNA